MNRRAKTLIAVAIQTLPPLGGHTNLIGLHPSAGSGQALTEFNLPSADHLVLNAFAVAACFAWKANSADSTRLFFINPSGVPGLHLSTGLRHNRVPTREWLRELSGGGGAGEQAKVSSKWKVKRRGGAFHLAVSFQLAARK
jgi:hypothetical protein